MSVTPALQVGDRFADRYELRAPLRGDEVVRVFLAFDHHAGRDVTLFLFDTGSAHPNAWSTFARLVISATAARIPGLILPQSLGDTAPVPPCCLAEVLVARGFDRLRDQGPLAWERACMLGERVAEILHRVHAATGVAHRALTPARCAVTIRDDVKVLDYGIAELMPGGLPDTGYRAPEQQAGNGDARSDMYALGAILFELIAGQRPTGSGPHHLRKLVPVPRPVDDLLARALAHDPDQRFADLVGLRSALRELLGLGAAPPVEPAVAPPPAVAPAPAVAEALARPLAATPLPVGVSPPRPTTDPPTSTPSRMVPGAKPLSPLFAVPIGAPLPPIAPAPLPPVRPAAVAPRPGAPQPPPFQPADRTEVLRPATFTAPAPADPADRTEVLGGAFAQALPRASTAAPHSPRTSPPASLGPMAISSGPVRTEERVLKDTTDVFDRVPASTPVSPDRTEILGTAVPLRAEGPPADRTEVLTSPVRELFPMDAPPEPTPRVFRGPLAPGVLVGGAASRSAKAPAETFAPAHDGATEQIPVPPPPRDTTLDLGPNPVEEASTTRMAPLGACPPEPVPELLDPGAFAEADPDATTQWVRPLHPPATPASPSPTPLPAAASPPPTPSPAVALLAPTASPRPFMPAPTPAPRPAPPAPTVVPDDALKRTLLWINLACVAAVILGLLVMALRS